MIIDLNNVIQNIIFWSMTHGVKIILILLGVVSINKFIHLFIKKGIHQKIICASDEGEQKRIETIVDIIKDIINGLVWTIAILMILSEIGIDTSPLLGGLGVIGLAVSFASKNLVQDFIRGFFIIFENQYCIGDLVKIAGIEGVVKDINPRTTILQSEDKSIHIIPNREIKIVSKINKI